MFYISLVIGFGCGIIGALMAFVITRNEFQKHQFHGRQLLKVSLQAAVTTFAIFLGSAIVLGYLLIRFVQR